VQASGAHTKTLVNQGFLAIPRTGFEPLIVGAWQAVFGFPQHPAYLT